MKKQVLALVLSLVTTLSQAAYAADADTDSPAPTPSASAEKAATMKVEITTGDRSMTATLHNNETARDFASLLPVTLTMHDLFGREKAGGLPRAISEGGTPQSTYEVGDLGYWSPGSDLARPVSAKRRKGTFLDHDGVVDLLPSLPAAWTIGRTRVSPA